MARETRSDCVRRLSVAPGDKTNDAHYGDAERICALLRFDLAALRANAAREIPYAKAWIKDVEDGWVGGGGKRAKTECAAGEDTNPETATPVNGLNQKRKPAKRKRRCGSIKRKQ